MKRESNPRKVKQIHFAIKRVALVLPIIFTAWATARSQSAHVTIEVLPDAKQVRVSGQLEKPQSEWLFHEFYAAVSGLAGRITHFQSPDASAHVPVARLSPNHFRAERPVERFSYVIDTGVPSVPANAPYASWIGPEHGLLMLYDLLPVELLTPDKGKPSRFELRLPSGWEAAGALARDGQGDFLFDEPEKTVIAVGRDLRQSHSTVTGINLTVVAAGDWAFQDAELSNLIRQIIDEHARRMGAPGWRRAALVLLPFPAAQLPQRWSAETRGNTTVLISGRQQAKQPAFAQLSVALTHEAMHLWVPNGLSLSGNYDWFYEGFTLYQSLRVGMDLGLFSFQDYLTALGRAYDAYAGAAHRDDASLITLSDRRWAGAEQLIYNKGMLVAFLYDLTLRSRTGNKRSLDDVYRDLLSRGRSQGGSKAANTLVPEILASFAGMDDFVERYVLGTAPINLSVLIEPFGMEVKPNPVRSHVGVISKPSGKQKALLKKLGYNNAAR
jgi:predicted metalloprotease with PDZ domain